MLALAAAAPAWAQADLPDAPSPHSDAVAESAGTSPALRFFAHAEPALVPAAADGAGQQTFPPQARVPGLEPNYVPLPRQCVANACSQITPLSSCCQPGSDVFSSYLRQNAVHIYTPRELGHIAIRGVADPFNLLTIGATSLYSVGTDAHSPYGPGAMGWAKISGVTLTEDMTSELVGTFIIPSIDHQDPHYHRMPNASLMRRILHCAYQPFWTPSDTGKNMVNYSTFVGSIVEEAVDVTYVPYQREGWGAGAERVAAGWASAPIGNYVTEFFPDVARRINLKVVFLQRIVNQVALENGGQ
ncbi:MAG: hypothetical protein ACLGXA_20015 [Acidobacteriota bacterium]